MLNLTWATFIEQWTESLILNYSRHTGKPVTLPVPVLDIAERLLHLKCDTENLTGKLSRTSAIIIPAKRWIILNKNQSVTRMRFTLAHEIAHWLIEAPGTARNNETEACDITVLRTASSNEREKIAEYFAGALLMPKQVLVDTIPQDTTVSSAVYKQYASFFGVSSTALRIRLQQVKRFAFATGSQTSQIVLWSQKASTTQSNSTCPVVVIPSPTIDHRLIRYLKTAKSSLRQVFVAISREYLHLKESLSEIQGIDGIIFSDSLTLDDSAIKEEVGKFELVDIRHHNYYYEAITSQETLKKLPATLNAYTRDKENVVPFKQLVIKSIENRVKPPSRLPTRQDAKQYIKVQKNSGKTVVIVTGCFDLITNAHVRFLRMAREAGDALIVGIESDKRISAFKGPLRPVNTAFQRIEVLNEMKCIDFVFVIYGDPQSETKSFYTRLHKYLQADVLAVTEGDPYLNDRQAEIMAAGGKILVLEKLPNVSSTSLIRKALNQTGFSDLAVFPTNSEYKLDSNSKSLVTQLPLPL